MGELGRMLRGLAALHAIQAANVITTFIKKRFTTLTSVVLEDEIGCGKDKNEIQTLQRTRNANKSRAGVQRSMSNEEVHRRGASRAGRAKRHRKKSDSRGAIERGSRPAGRNLRTLSHPEHRTKNSCTGRASFGER
jgi:hypothetical protein